MFRRSRAAHHPVAGNREIAEFHMDVRGTAYISDTLSSLDPVVTAMR